MTTEELNNYLFADVLHRHAQAAWKRRIKRLEAEGLDNAMDVTPLGAEDLQEALDVLHWFGDEGRRLLAQAQPGRFQPL